MHRFLGVAETRYGNLWGKNPSYHGGQLKLQGCFRKCSETHTSDLSQPRAKEAGYLYIHTHQSLVKGWEHPGKMLMVSYFHGSLSTAE